MEARAIAHHRWEGVRQRPARCIRPHRGPADRWRTALDPEVIVILLKRILVPTDFSAASAAAVQYGVALARAFKAKLHLLHVEPRHDLEIMVERELVVEKALSTAAGTTVPQNPARELLAKILTEDEEHELRAEYVLRAGGPYVEIVRYAKERNIDLIVMGAHGRGVVAHMLMGSVAEKMVRQAPCPVLTVRHPEHEFILPD
jgi:nucleotide-binding universal stress UspA family protein